MDLPQIETLELTDKIALLRLDTDLPVENGVIVDDSRLKVAIPTIKLLIEKGCRTISCLGHRGRPEGKKDPSLSLALIDSHLKELLSNELPENSLEKISFQENLRFDPGEEENSQTFAKSLAQSGQVYINEAFGVSHREHASIVGLPKLLPHAAGVHFIEEVKNLEAVFKTPQRPLVMIVSGIKSDKLKYLEDFGKLADRVLIGGRLPEYIHDNSPLRKSDKFLIANLIADKEDISIHSIEGFEKEIETARTIVISGPLGKFEDEGHMQGTQRILGAVSKSSAFKLGGGGDTTAALEKFSLKESFDWLSSGGGAMLEFLAKGTLPGIEALLG